MSAGTIINARGGGYYHKNSPVEQNLCVLVTKKAGGKPPAIKTKEGAEYLSKTMYKLLALICAAEILSEELDIDERIVGVKSIENNIGKDSMDSCADIEL